MPRDYVAWESAVVEAASTPPDSEPGYGMTLKLRYPDGTVRYVAVGVTGMSERHQEASDSHSEPPKRPGK